MVCNRTRTDGKGVVAVDVVRHPCGQFLRIDRCLGSDRAGSINGACTGGSTESLVVFPMYPRLIQTTDTPCLLPGSCHDHERRFTFFSGECVSGPGLRKLADRDSGNSQTGTPAERCDVTPLGCNALCEDILEYVGLFDSGETDVQALKFDTQSAVVDTH